MRIFVFVRSGYALRRAEERLRAVQAAALPQTVTLGPVIEGCRGGRRAERTEEAGGERGYRKQEVGNGRYCRKEGQAQEAEGSEGQRRSFHSKTPLSCHSPFFLAQWQRIAQEGGHNL